MCPIDEGDPTGIFFLYGLQMVTSLLPSILIFLLSLQFSPSNEEWSLEEGEEGTEPIYNWSKKPLKKGSTHFSHTSLLPWKSQTFLAQHH